MHGVSVSEKNKLLSPSRSEVSVRHASTHGEHTRVPAMSSSYTAFTSSLSMQAFFTLMSRWA